MYNLDKYHDHCECDIREIIEAEERNRTYHWLNFNEMGGSYKSYLTHKVMGHKIVEVKDCSPVGAIEYCECGKSWAM